MALIFLVALAAMQGSGATVRDVGWLSGCWELTRGGRHVIETWSPPEGGTMVSFSRTVVDGKTTEWEFVVLREGARGLEYVAHPGRQAPATFTSTSVTPNEVVFENPAHDFPRKISYTRRGEALTAAIEGPVDGRTRRIEFPYQRIACPE